MRDSSIAGLAKVLSKDTNINVTVSGNGSYIDHKGNINIALMPDTPKGRMLTTGLTFHEVGHKNHSDLTSKPSGLVGHIANIIEDIWTERKTIEERPGTRFNLDEVTTHYASSGSLDPKNLNHAICGKAMAYGRKKFLSQNGISVIEPKCDEMMDDAFGASFIQELIDIIEDIPLIKSSADAIEMARKVEALVVNQKPKPQPQPPVNNNPNNNPQGEDDGQGNSTSSGSESSDDEQSEAESGESEEPESGSNQPDIDESSDQEDEQGDEESEQEADGDQNVEEDKGCAPEPESTQGGGGNGAGGKANLTEAQIDKLLKAQDSYGDLSYLIAKEMDDLAFESYSPEALKQPLLPPITRDKNQHHKLDEVKAISASSKMRARMMGMLQDMKRMPESFGSSGKKLSAGRLVKIAFGDPRIFSRKKEVKEINTAVVICIDYSGSMSGNTKVSNPAAFAIHHALHGLKGSAVASIGFGCCCNNGNQETMLLVNFKEKPISSKFNIPAQGGTPTHEAIWAARAMLLERPEPRKIILIITDGEPDCRQTARFATERTEKDGVEIAAIGVGTECVKHLWKKSKCINGVTELPQAMFTIMDEMLVGRA